MLPLRSPGRRSSDRRISGSGWLASALTNPAAAAAAVTTAAMTSGDVQPRTTPWDTANTISVTAQVISRAPRTSRRCAVRVGGFGVPEDGGGQGGGSQADRDVDQEHRAPAGELDQHAAEDLAGHEAYRGDRAVQADGTRALRPFGKAGGDERQRGGSDDGGARALEDPGGEQQRGVPGQSARQAGQRERDEADDEHAPPAEQVSGPAAEDEQAAERDRVPGDDPLHRVGGHVQLALDRGQRDVDDAEIQDDHERGDENESQLDGAVGRGFLGWGFWAGALGVGAFRLGAGAWGRRWPGLGGGGGGGAGVAVVGSRVSEGAVPDMIPIRYVTDRFVFQEGRTGR